MSDTQGFDIEVPVLVVGAGPAGLAATLLLHQYGVKALTVTRYGWTANSPRAHFQNQRTIEILRELGLEQEVVATGMPDHLAQNFVWASSLAGTEFARLPHYTVTRRDEYRRASPCPVSNIPQHMLEPILARAAKARGASIRWKHELLDLSQDAEGATARIRNRVSGRDLVVRAQYVIGADGGRSRVAEAVGITHTGPAGWAAAINVWFRADLTAYCAHRPGILYLLNRPGGSFWIGSGIFINVRPWNEWVLSFMYDPRMGEPDLAEAALLARVRDLVGNEELGVELLGASSWQMNAQVADKMSEGRVFIAGDAAHRHPPTNALGSYTSIQDAYNLVWKLKLVLEGLAPPALLDSYNLERRPVAQQVIDRTMQSVREHGSIGAAIGFAPDQTEAEGWKEYAKLSDPGEMGRERRQALSGAIDLLQYQCCTHGVEMGVRYGEGAMVAEADSLEARDSWRERQLVYVPTTAPGAHLPHAWLEREGKALSTIDLVGGGRFALVVGHDHLAWLQAAEQIHAEFGFDLPVYSIGRGLMYEDVWREWANVRGVDDSGCLLVRPDKVVGWRCLTAPEDASGSLRAALRQILNSQSVGTPAKGVGEAAVPVVLASA